MLVATGGAVSNTGVSLHKLGMRVRLLARIGNDTIGYLAREVVARHGAGLVEFLHEAEGEPSSYTIVISPPDTDRTFLHCPGTNNTFGPEDVPDDLLADTRLFHFGYPPLMRRMFANGGRELADILGRARAAGATTSLDMVMPDPVGASGRADWPAICARVLPLVDLFVPSAEELLYMLDKARFQQLAASRGAGAVLEALTTDDIRWLANTAIGLGAQIVLLKLGHRGVYLRTAGGLASLGRGFGAEVGAWCSRELWAPCFRTKVVGTVGAGDAAIAGFLTAILHGQAATDSLLAAAASGACNVEAADATSGVRSWQDTQARLAQGWPQADLPQPASGWVRDGAARMWRGPEDGLGA
jgi:sugar/nucleoside kinase (ribokinase family)